MFPFYLAVVWDLKTEFFLIGKAIFKKEKKTIEFLKFSFFYLVTQFTMKNRLQSFLKSKHLLLF